MLDDTNPSEEVVAMEDAVVEGASDEDTVTGDETRNDSEGETPRDDGTGGDSANDVVNKEEGVKENL